jgi:hypothetical protein
VKTLVSLLALWASGMVAMPASAHWVYATDASFQYQAGQAGIGRSGGNDANALGNDRNSTRSLGIGGAAVFSFDTSFTDRIRFWDSTQGTGQWPSNLSVFVGNSWDVDNPNFRLDLSQWTSLGTLNGPDVRHGSTLRVPGVFQYLLIVDSSARGQRPFNIASVSVLAAPGSSESPTVAAVPVPGALWLFGSGLLGLAAVAKRRSSRRR